MPNLKSLIKGANKSFKFCNYTALYLGTFNYRFNHLFDLTNLVIALITKAVLFGPQPERVIRRSAEVHA